MTAQTPTFARVPIEALRDKRLTLEQFRVLGALLSFRRKVGDVVWPSRQAIADVCGIHPANISSATSALERLGWLTKDGKGGHSKATRYTITVPETLAHSATVADAATVADSATRPLADSATRLPLAESATRKEERSEQRNGRGAAARFAHFWSAYPKKVARADAEKAFAKQKIDDALLERILLAIADQSRTDEWRCHDGKFVPHPATWLNGHRWEDETGEASPKAHDIFAGAI